MLIETYNPEWPAFFKSIAQVITEALSGISHRIEHVRSTAVPGLSAKPIIDIDVVYMNAGDFLKIGRCLYTAGYVHNGNQGIPEREAFKRTDIHTFHHILDSIRHHLFVCPVNEAW